jgi:hypothetical protein
MKRKKSKATSKYVCACCGADIARHFPAIAYDAPFYWNEEMVGRPDCSIDSDFCEIEKQDFFIRTVLQIPIIDTDQTFDWGVWVSVSAKNYQRYSKIFDTGKELKEKAYFGWFSNQIPIYPDCLGIKTNVHLQGGGLRPLLELDHTNPHPLCQEQHNGITVARAHEISDSLLK